MRSITNHASDRQSQRGIKRNHINLCISKGTRTNVPAGDLTNRWRHKYMYHGLHVICETMDGTVVTAYWTATTPEDIEQSIARYERLVEKRRVRAADKSMEAKTHKEKQKAVKTESVQFNL